MHAPDGFLDPGTAVVTAVLSASAVGLALRRSGTDLGEREVPLAGVSAAFLFAAQMVNFPVAAGTSGHLLGAALAAVLLGPNVGVLVATVVVVIQALVFADGGLTALGYNVMNLAVVPAFGGAALFAGFRRLLPATASGVMAATGLAAGLSVVLSATALSIQWLFGATAPVPFDTVFGAMVSVHALIGVGEGVISALAVGAVLAARPDLVAGARDLPAEALVGRRRLPRRALVAAIALTALVVATALSQFADGDPDGLEKVAATTGIDDGTERPSPARSLFADYAVEGIGNERLSLAVAGASGVALALAVGSGMAMAAGGRRRAASARVLNPTR